MPSCRKGDRERSMHAMASQGATAAKNSMPASETPPPSNDVPRHASPANEHANGSGELNRLAWRPSAGSRRSSSTWSWCSSTITRLPSVGSCASKVVVQNCLEDPRRYSAPDGPRADDMILDAMDQSGRRNSAPEIVKKQSARRNSAPSLTDAEFEEFLNRKISSRETGEMTYSERKRMADLEEVDGSLGTSIGSPSRFSDVGARRIRGRRTDGGRIVRATDVSNAERVKHSVVPYNLSNAERLKHSRVPNNTEPSNQEEVAEAADESGSFVSSIGSLPQFSGVGARRIGGRRTDGAITGRMNTERVKQVLNSDANSDHVVGACPSERFKHGSSSPSAQLPDEDRAACLSQRLPGEDKAMTAFVQRTPQVVGVEYSDDEESMAADIEAAWNAGAEARRERDNRRFSTSSMVSEEGQDFGRGSKGAIHAIVVDDKTVDGIPLEIAVHVSLSDKVWRIKKVVGGVALALLIVAVVTLAVLGQKWKAESYGDSEDFDVLPPPPPVHDPTLVQRRKEGVLRCGVSNRPGFSRFNNDRGEREGMSVDLCKAVAAAVLGVDYRIETIEVLSTTRFTALAGREIDLLMWGDTHTMERDFHEKVTGVGFQFSDPYFYDGLRFAGVPHAVKCADTFNWVGNCSDLSICVMDGVTHLDILSPIFPRQKILPKETEASYLQGLIDGSCSVIAGELNQIVQITVRNAGYEGEYVYGDTALSKEPLALVTRKEDQGWSDVVNWVLRALIHAEECGVMQQNAKTKLQGHSFVAALEAVGNYGEIWARHMEPIVPRKGLNLLYAASKDSDSGLHYSHPLGAIDNFHHEFDSSGIINRIVDRGKLVCGAFDTEYQSIDKDFCRALAASLFYSDSGLVEFVDVGPSNESSSILERLDSGEIDVVAGASVDFLSDFVLPSNETALGVSGLAFSPPYFYGGNGLAPLALATSQTDLDWSSFVYWVVAITIWAEENSITSNEFQEAPRVKLFGPRFEWMFRGCIFRGNYAEIYSRNADGLPRRATYNLLNNGSSPQLYPPPINQITDMA